MNANDNTLSNEQISSQIQLQNKGFAILDEVFKQHGWSLVRNDMNWISYTKMGDETSNFSIKITKDKIVVSVPLKNSIYQFVTAFNNYYEASEYIEQKFYDYIR